jgi:4-amino-4-deoxy-L-arabinose transferase-like glycosyltransferase
MAPNRLLADWRICLLLLLGLWAVIYMTGLARPALLDDADTVHAEAAKEMLQRHDWVTLYVNGIRYLEKAPLMYWGVATSYTLFGISEWSTRLPLMLGVLAMILATYGLGRWTFGSEGGFDSALVLATALGPFLFTRFLIPDVPVGLWLTLTFWLFLVSLEQTKPSRWICWGLAAVCALNVLTKGLIGLVFPAGAIGLYLLLTGNLRLLFKLRLFSSSLVFLAIAAPWHILAALRNPPQGNVRGFLWFYFVNEHILRFLNRRVPRDYDTVPLLLFWVLLVLWLIPWTVFLPQSLQEVPRRWREFRSQMTRRQRAYLLFFLWNVVIVGFFSLSTRQEYYVLPALPALAILIAGWLAQECGWQPITDRAKKIRCANLRATSVLLALGSIFAVATLVFLIYTHAPAPDADLAQLVAQNPADYALSMGHFLDLNAAALGLFRLPLALAAAALFLGPLCSFILRKRNQPHAATLALAAGAFGFLLAAHLALQTFAPVLSSQQLAAAIAPQLHADDLIVIHQEYEFASTLGFYLRRPGYSFYAPPAYPGGIAHPISWPRIVNPIHILEGRSSNLWYGSFFPNAPPIFETPQSLAEKWPGPQRIFLWQDLANQPSPLPALPGPVYVIARSGGKQILSNQPNHS